MRKVVLLLAALLVLIPVAGADIADEIRTLDGSGNNRNHPDWGKTNTQYLRVARSELRRRDRETCRRPADPLRQQPRLQRRRTRTCSRRTASPSGASSGGSSWTTRSVCARRPAARPRRSPSTRPTRSRPSRIPRLDPRSRARRPRPAPAPATPATADQHGLELHRRLQRLRRDTTRLEWLREGRSTEPSPTTGRSCCLPTASCLAAMSAATRATRPRWL